MPCIMTAIDFDGVFSKKHKHTYLVHLTRLTNVFLILIEGENINYEL